MVFDLGFDEWWLFYQLLKRVFPYVESRRWPWATLTHQFSHHWTQRFFSDICEHLNFQFLKRSESGKTSMAHILCNLCRCIFLDFFSCFLLSFNGWWLIDIAVFNFIEIIFYFYIDRHILCFANFIYCLIVLKLGYF